MNELRRQLHKSVSFTVVGIVFSHVNWSPNYNAAGQLVWPKTGVIKPPIEPKSQLYNLSVESAT